MEKLTAKEEEIMQILWEIRKGLVHAVIERLSKPKPPYSTVSSVIRILERKGYVGHKAYGKTHEYFPIISKKDYGKRTFRYLLQNYFDNSLENIVSFLVKEEKLKPEEIEELNRIIQQNAAKRKKNDKK
ncbi:hypothetical protein ES705_48194 [subsurface metagenome]